MIRHLLVALAVGIAAPAFAEKPEWAGGGKDKGSKHEGKHDKHGGKHKDKQDKQDKHGKRNEERREVRVGGYFNERDRQVATVYYGERTSGGKSCPPGLAKKNNGCMPPGQAKKYQVGQPLPSAVVVYPVPNAVLVQLPPPPSGHKYVRVAADILLIAVGTSMVVDAITDLTRL
jgi:Ni/Co efflux regulator RcnB